ncbi:MAG TPA: AI-2E family transporter [Candidatus Nanoarchaeia archaeon]|nr:AI-2E family transporter [Candidatus Nanoarchaeia archaeon]
MLLLIFLVISFLILKPILLSIFLGALLAYLSYPLHDLFSRKIKNKFIPSLLVSIIVLLVIVIPGVVLLSILAEQSYSLFLIGKQKISAGIFENCANSFCSMLKENLRDLGVKLQLQNLLKAVTTWFIQKGSVVLASVPRFILNVFIVFFTMFYFLKDGKKFLQKINQLLSLGDTRYSFIMQRLKEIIHGLVFGSLLVAIIQGLLGALGFFIFGVPLPLLWGVIMAFLALIPALGTGLVWFPASLILFLNGFFQGSDSLMIKGLLLLLYSITIVGTIDNILKPKLVGSKAKIHPLIIFVGIFGGLIFFGVWGVILGPLFLSMTSVFIELFISQKLS